MSTQLPSGNTTAYLGVFSTNPPQVYVKTNGPPLTLSAVNYNIGDLWIDRTTAVNQAWILAGLDYNTPVPGVITARWRNIAGAIGVGIQTLTGNLGGAAGPILGNCNILGDGLAASGVMTALTPPGDTLTISVQNATNAGAKGVSTYAPAQFTTVAGLVSIVDASVAVKGIAQFNPVYFNVAAGVVSLTGFFAFSWVPAVAAQPITQNTGYFTNVPGLTTFTLPAIAAVGSVIAVQGASAGGWRINQAIGQQVIFSDTRQTTAGAGGYCFSIDSKDGIELLCITANTTWVATKIKGNISVV